MVLFKDDYQSSPVIDLSTRNITFLEYAYSLKESGIKNWAFCLILHNAELIGVDPFSKDLTVLQKTAIILEAAENPWYFFREVVRVPAHGNCASKYFKANAFSIPILWSHLAGISLLIAGPRQVGKLLPVDMLLEYSIILSGYHTSEILFKDDNIRSISILTILNNIELLPDFFKSSVTPQHIKDPIEKLVCKPNSTCINTSVANQIAKYAALAYRGQTFNTFVIRDALFVKNLDKYITNALPSMNYANELVEANSLGGMIVITNYDDLKRKDSEGSKYVYDTFVKNQPVWDDTLYDTLNCNNIKDTFTVKKDGKATRLC